VSDSSEDDEVDEDGGELCVSCELVRGVTWGQIF